MCLNIGEHTAYVQGSKRGAAPPSTAAIAAAPCGKAPRKGGRKQAAAFSDDNAAWLRPAKPAAKAAAKPNGKAAAPRGRAKPNGKRAPAPDSSEESLGDSDIMDDEFEGAEEALVAGGDEMFASDDAPSSEGGESGDEDDEDEAVRPSASLRVGGAGGRMDPELPDAPYLRCLCKHASRLKSCPPYAMLGDVSDVQAWITPSSEVRSTPWVL